MTPGKKNFMTKKEMAMELEISIKTLYLRLKKYNIPYDGELLPINKAKNIMDMLRKVAPKSNNTDEEVSS